MGSGPNCASTTANSRPDAAGTRWPMRQPKRRFAPRFVATLAAANGRRVWAFAEGRCGLRVGLRQRWCPRGVRPPWLVHDRYEWLWLSAAVAPATGQRLVLRLPRVTKEGF